MKIRVGAIESMRTPEEWGYIPDDRQERIKIINGIAIQDYGHIEEGDTLSCKAVFKSSDFETLLDYWENRIKVDITDESGKLYENMRVVVKRYSYMSRFPQYIFVDLEFWRK